MQAFICPLKAEFMQDVVLQIAVVENTYFSD